MFPCGFAKVKLRLKACADQWGSPTADRRNPGPGCREGPQTVDSKIGGEGKVDSVIGGKGQF